MIGNLVSGACGAHEAVSIMRRRLDDFYATTTDYPAFQSDRDNSHYYRQLEPYLREFIAAHGRVRVLELGAGRATFPIFFKEIRSQIEYHAQDVTPQNLEYLQSIADAVHIDDVTMIQGEFDLIFSTFVLEHVSSPVKFLESVRRLLAPGGVHVVICPRYDLPGYLCPSLRHLGLCKRLAVTTCLSASRLCAWIDGRARFWINCDPGVFHGPFFRDADAVHIVSQADVVRWHRRNGFSVQRVRLASSGWRERILRSAMTLSIACRKLS